MNFAQIKAIYRENILVCYVQYKLTLEHSLFWKAFDFLRLSVRLCNSDLLGNMVGTASGKSNFFLFNPSLSMYIIWKYDYNIYIPETSDCGWKESSVKCLPQTQEYSDGECQSALVVLICLFQRALVCGFLGKVKRLTPSLCELLQLATTNLFPILVCRIDCCCKFPHVIT